MRTFSILAVTALAVAGCAPMDDRSSAWDPSQDGQCLRPSRAENFRVRSDQTLYLMSDRGDVYRLEGPKGCFDAATTTSVDVEPYLSGSQRLCDGDRARVRVGSSSPVPMTCIAQVRARLSDEEIRASGLPARDRS